jgi:hypothetical protein
MKSLNLSLAALLLASGPALSTPPHSTWTFAPNGRTASLSDTRLSETPLKLACAQRGYLEIDILSGPSTEVNLVGPSKIVLTISGKPRPNGRIVSDVYFKSLTVEFLREAANVEVSGGLSYRLDLTGARRVLDTLESSCLAVS